MLKSVILATAAIIAAPVMAQDTVNQPATQDSTMSSQPTPTEPVTGDTSATQPATTAQPAGPAQIAQIVDAEFPTYDKDSSSDLNKEEFGAWMIALRTASEPGVDAQSAEVKTWTGQAFASADADKSSTVTKAELTSFLAKGQAS